MQGKIDQIGHALDTIMPKMRALKEALAAREPEDPLAEDAAEIMRLMDEMSSMFPAENF